MTTDWVAAEGSPNAPARPRSRHAHAKRTPAARRLRTLIATVLLVAVLAAVGVASLALVRGIWMVTPILSGSMRPGLSVGGVAISERVPVDSLAVRDVIVFQRPDNPSEQVVHRIVQVVVGNSALPQIITQGDANTVRDPWTLTIRGDYAYRVRWSFPLIGYVVVAFQNHRGFAVLGASIVLIVIALTMVSGSRRRRRRRDDGEGESTDQGDPRPGVEHVGDLNTPGDADALGSDKTAGDWPLPRHGDTKRPTPVPSRVPSFGQDRDQ